MIIGKRREIVIENIAKATRKGEFNCKVEVGDPVLTKEQGEEISKKFLTGNRKLSYKLKALVARRVANIATNMLNKDTKILGLDKLGSFKDGAIITCNHFNHLDNTIVRYMARELGKRRINIVSQQTNFKVGGPIGYLMKYADTIPLGNNYKDTYKNLLERMKKLIERREYILIYPEQEMWFNYRKPRPLMRGAYHFAALLNAPIISCFIEMQDKEESDNDEFYKVRYNIHILDVLYPDPVMNKRECEEYLRMKDYELKKEAYERIYGKTLIYDFEPSDIAGWKGTSDKI